ncbi:NAD-dependent aldehyde dehydrogenase [Thelephora terrestris]|uniref:NAD-dependent aldehyde dehydrogenase n=1 Tax=Thelephora terrestris TaxID=56493 RepID=A0A9P6H629_9AGAM|nr:NAD-dependent aldehyde dehydrogenase [Thelephora terrestris]
MPGVFTHQFANESFNGQVNINTGLFIDGQWVDGSGGSTIDVLNPTNGELLAKVSEGTAEDVNLAVAAAQRAFDTTWGHNTPGSVRGILLNKLADKMESQYDALCAVEALDNGLTFQWAKNADVPASIATIRYYGGWADKFHGKTIETDKNKLAYTIHEPIGVVGQIIPWNFPLLMLCWKIGPALATGNAIVMKPSEFTPLSALMMAEMIHQVGFPAGAFNLVVGYGSTVGQTISEHPLIEKVAFTGSTVTGRKIMEAAAKSNLKNVTLELGGKSPNIIFNDADIDQAVNWAAHGVYWNHGQCCCAGSRIFVQSKIYQEFLEKFTKKVKSIKVGDPFGKDTNQGPQVSQLQFDRIMSYIESGKEQGANIHLGGGRVGDKGYYVEPTIFTGTKPEMKIVQEEIFGPVAVVIKFEDEDDVVRQANDTLYGLAAAVFSKDIDRALQTVNKLKAGTVWVNCINVLNHNVPFGGFKQSGIGRELGEYALSNYTNVKAVHVNIGQKMF